MAEPRYSPEDLGHLEQVAIAAYESASRLVDTHEECLYVAVTAVLADPRIADRLMPLSPAEASPTEQEPQP